MQQERNTNTWQPEVGDNVRIRGSQFAGEVIKTKGVSELRIRIKVSSTTDAGNKLPPAEARAARIASRWYGLDELESTS